MLLVYMPYILLEVNPTCYAVVDSIKMKIHSKCSTKNEAINKIMYLSSIYYFS